MSVASSIIPDSVRMLREAGRTEIPGDSLMGQPFRPFAVGQSGERTATFETLYDFFINDVPDPDETMRLDPDFLTRIRQHPVVASAMNKRAGAVKSFPEHIQPNPAAPDQSVAKLVADYVAWRWDCAKGKPDLYEWLERGATIEGGAAAEVMWAKDAEGRESPACFYPMRKNRFVRDRLGNMALKTRSLPVYGTYVQGNPGDYLMPTVPYKFIYHINRAEPGFWEKPEFEGYTYWGIGEDVALYYPVTFDEFAWRMHMKFIQQYGMPIRALYYQNNADQQTKAHVQRIAREMHKGVVLTIPRPVGQGSSFDDMFKVDTLASPTMTTDMFGQLHDLIGRYIDTLLLGSAEENNPSEGGGYSDHVSRRESGPQSLYAARAKKISDTLNAQVLPFIALSRWQGLPQAYWPVHVMQPKEERDYKVEIENASKAGQMIPLSRSELRERFGYRPPKDEGDSVFLGASDGFGGGLVTTEPGLDGAGRQPLGNKAESGEGGGVETTGIEDD